MRDYTADLIGLSGLTRIDVARTYALALGPGATADWPKVNKAIVERWSPAGLKYIKQLAWNYRKEGAVRP